MKKIRGLGASAHADTLRAKDDYYATPPEAVEKLLEKESFQKYIFEPACGEGHISRILEKKGYDVISSDIVYRGYGSQGDFFAYEASNYDIITNPPYNQALEFIQHAIKISEKGVKIAMLMRIQFLESAKRYEFFKQFPPKKIYVFSKRIQCAKDGNFENLGPSTICYAWFVWEVGYLGETTIDWIL